MTRLSVLLIVLAACHAQVRYVAGTRVPYSDANDAVLKAVEDYRLAVERADVDALMLMAHKQYWEDSGTPSGSDDYGYDGLRNVLLTRLPRASDIRYTMRYVNVRQTCPTDLKPGCRASVAVLLAASFTITNALGEP